MLRNFHEAEVHDLCGQHTQDTGQQFAAEVVHALFDLTQGYPWLENALAQEMVERVVPEYGDVRVPMELKVWRPDEPDPIKDGLRQIDEYLDGLALDTGWLVVFDRRDESKVKKLSRQASAKTRKTKAGRKVTVIRA